MANVHYAEIGDVWKHLLLAEVLGIEGPRRYLESHAASSSYPLSPSAERSYGNEEASETFLHADPYLPLEAGNDGTTSVDLLGRAAALGTRCMLWYRFDSTRDRDAVLGTLRCCAAGMREAAGDHRPLWFGEVSLRYDDLSEVGFDPGVLGCGSSCATSARRHLGRALVWAMSSPRCTRGRGSQQALTAPSYSVKV